MREFQDAAERFLTEFNNSFGRDAGATAIPVGIDGLPSMVGRASSPAVGPLTSPGKFSVRDMYFFYLARTTYTPSNSLFADSFTKHSPGASTGALYVIINMGLGMGLKIFQVNEAALGLIDLGRTVTENFEGRLTAKSTQFIIADTPDDYDDAYNKQAWLPLKTDEGMTLLSPANTTFFRYSKMIWKLDDPGIEVSEHGGRGSVYDDPCSSFCGLFNWESRTVKNNLFAYEFTTDLSHKGKDVVYVDDDGVCHCPVTGYPLKCVLRSIDYKDHYTTERASWP